MYKACMGYEDLQEAIIVGYAATRNKGNWDYLFIPAKKMILYAAPSSSTCETGVFGSIQYTRNLLLNSPKSLGDLTPEAWEILGLNGACCTIAPSSK